MKSLLFVFMLTAVLLGYSSFAREFVYQPYSGTCENSLGAKGLNQISIDDLHKTGDGECADLRDIDLDEEMKANLWTGWNLRGADLIGAKLFFAYIADANLEGTNLSGLNYGYAHVKGTVDRFTAIPKHGKCKVANSKIECVR